MKVYIERTVLKIKKSENTEVLKIGDTAIEEHLLMSNILQPFYITELLSQQDWSIFEREGSRQGRTPYSPQIMVGLIVYGLMQGISSLRDLERMARVDLGCIHITGGQFPNYSVISRFISRHRDALSESFFIGLTKKILKSTRSGVRSLAGDGTIIEAASSRYKLVRQEALERQQKEVEKELKSSPDNKRLKGKEERLNQAREELEQRVAKRKAQGKSTDTVAINPIEPEAVPQPGKKSKTSLPSYKPSVLANDSRVIVAIDVHPSSEIESLTQMLDNVEQLNEGAVEELLLDGGYLAHEVLSETIERQIKLLCSRDDGKKKAKKDEVVKFTKKDFIYNSSTDSYSCPNGAELKFSGKGKATRSSLAYQTYTTKACSTCPLKSRCTSNKKGREIKRFEGDELKEALSERMKETNAKKRLRSRKSMVEPVFSQLRGRQNFNRFRRKGLKGVKVEFALQAIAYNISRAIALFSAKDREGVCASVSNKRPLYLKALGPLIIALTQLKKCQIKPFFA